MKTNKKNKIVRGKAPWHLFNFQKCDDFSNISTRIQFDNQPVLLRKWTDPRTDFELELQAAASLNAIKDNSAQCVSKLIRPKLCVLLHRQELAWCSTRIGGTQCLHIRKGNAETNVACPMVRYAHAMTHLRHEKHQRTLLRMHVWLYTQWQSLISPFMCSCISYVLYTYS